MADTKMFKGAAQLGKRVPKWAWYVSGGVLVAGGIYYVRARQPVEAPSGDQYTDEGVVGYTDASQAPGIIVPPVIGGEAVPAELNTDIPQGTLDLLSGFFGDALTAIQEAQPTEELLGIIAGAGSPAPAATPGVVTVAPAPAPSPAAAPAPKPNPCTKLEGGYNCGATVNMGPNARRTFPGAIGWARVASGGSGADHWIDVHVRFCSRMERWRCKPNRNNHWAKTWSGSRPGIC